MSIGADVPFEFATVSAELAARGAALGHSIHWLTETGSTSDDAKHAARLSAPHGTVFVAEAQTKGRGRQGRVWTSAPGENLLFSVVLRVGCAPISVPLLSLAAGLSVRDAVAGAVPCSEQVLVKWPNDVVVRGEEGQSRRLRKIAGILVESSLVGSRVDYVVIGVGVNVHCRSFPDDIANLATSIALQGQRAPDRGALLVDILVRLERDIDAVLRGGLGAIHSRLSASDALLGRRVMAEDGTLEGTARGIDPHGHLLVERADGALIKIAWGEVRLSS
jgi:BirA family biotin operon repressor/biotin-[acetyl-CoA-carboxylase] ligase